VLQTIAVLKTKGFAVSERNIRNGLLKVVKNTGLLGRWQVLNEQPKVICDTAHNAEGLRYVLKQLQQEKFDRLHIVLGVVNDKDLTSVLPLFPKKATYYFCRPNIPRGLDEFEFQHQCAKFQLMGEAYHSVETAYKTALKNTAKSDLIYVGGSTFVVAEVV
jgi:dihydrofolate synthase/folylpolyglutamate synthase